MHEFVAIDFETANPKRVSACAMGYAKVRDGKIVETNGYLIKPVGGHAPFQSRIHGIKKEHTRDKPEFGELFPEIRDLFDYPIVAHSLFDGQVLNALIDYFGLELRYEYIDSCSIAKEKMPGLKNYKLKTLAGQLGIPAFKHHDAAEDAAACAQIMIKLTGRETAAEQKTGSRAAEFRGIVRGILADNEVNYKEVCELLYWLEDHQEVAGRHGKVYRKIKEVLEDDYLDGYEAAAVKAALQPVVEGCRQ